MVTRIIEERDGRRPVRRMRPDAARPRADPRGVRRAAARDVPHADRLPAEHGRRARIAARPRRRWRGSGGAARPRDAGRSTSGRGAIDLTVRDGRRGRRSRARRSPGRSPSRSTPAGAPSPASIGLILSDDAELADAQRRAPGHDRPDRRPVVPAAAARRVPAASGGGRSTGAARPSRFPLPPGSPAAPRRHRRLGRARDRAGRSRAAAARPATSAGRRPTSSGCW